MRTADPSSTTNLPGGPPGSDLRLSVVMSTYNRGVLLEDAIDSVLRQEVETPPFELIVVDNNSTDRTREIVERFAATDDRVRYVFEGRQGLSHARNAGVRTARAPLVAFTDDDVRVEAQWVKAVLRAGEENRHAELLGGRVLPLWPSSPPEWLTTEHWGPLALVDHGDTPLEVTAERAICLIGANLVCRRAVFDVVGLFAVDLQRVRDGIGSLEDHEFLLRVLRAGGRGVYDPRIVVHAEIQPNRLERAYHRRWHAGHGHYHALLRSPAMESTALGTLLGVPAHVYRQAFDDVVGWIRARRQPAVAFAHELRLRFFVGFFRTRVREYFARAASRLAGFVRRVVQSGASDAAVRKDAAHGSSRATSPPRITASAAAVARRLDARVQRVVHPGVRSVVFDARTAMEYGMMAPVHRRLLADPRVRTCLMSSERPERAGEFFRDAPHGSAVIAPRAAMRRRFDAYVAADFVWATLPRGTCRVQMFHGVAGKWKQIYDRPDRSMRQWDRLFFINRRRLQNYLDSGAIDEGSPAIRLVGMPKIDCLVDGSLTRDGVLLANGIDPASTTVLYAPTWTRFSSLNAMGEELVGRLIDAGHTVLVKLHDNSLDRTAYMNSGGVDWAARLKPILARGRGHLIASGDASPWLVAADVLITDHSSIGFEYLLLDRPLIRIEMPELISGADIAREYVELIATAATTVHDAIGTVKTVDRALGDPRQLSAARRALAAELFHDPGRATDRAVGELYALMELDVPAAAASAPPLALGGNPVEGAFSR